MNDRSEIIVKKKDGTEFLAEANISQVTVLGEKIYTVVLRDISERIIFEKRLQDSLSEKETLLREIHHRVKNNIQVIFHEMPCYGCDWKCIFKINKGEPTPCTSNIRVDEVWNKIKPLLN